MKALLCKLLLLLFIKVANDLVYRGSLAALKYYHKSN